jgi:hypothetical protein
MSHFLYAVFKEEPAPVGDGDAASWLVFYKLGATEETFIPMPPGLEDIRPGDTLWFAVNREMKGAAKVTRIEDDIINNRKEVWFEVPVLAHEQVRTHLKTAVIGKETADRWLKSLEAR